MPAVGKKAPVDYSNRLEKEFLNEFENHKADETTYGGGSDLPAGINGGVAQLVAAKIDEYKEGDNKGKLYLYLAGVVKAPESVNGVPIAGLRAQKTFRLFADGRTTKDQALAKALNAVRQMGGTTADIKIRQLPVLLEALVNDSPHFRFRTYEFKAEDRDEAMIITEFKGKIENYESNGSSSDAVVDNTSTPGGETQTPDEDWDVVVEAANGGDGAAQQKLVDTCVALGMTREEADGLPDWEACANVIKSGTPPTAESGEGDTGSGETSSDWKPEKGEEYSLKLKGMKSAQKLKVVNVFKETVHLVNESTKKDFKGIEWSSNPPSIGGEEI